MAISDELIVRPDSKGRITLGAYAKGVSSFRIHEQADGRLVLEPFAEIPAREVWLYKNTKALAMVEQGIKEAEEGKLNDLGDFRQFAED